jgi:radical SAM superfamily enzyme YgiQ (UPF0313 family)
MIGIENFSDNALEAFNKKINVNDIDRAILLLKNIGIPIDYGFIMYYPEMVPGEILYNVDMLQKYDLLKLFAITNVMQIYVGSEYENRSNDNIEIKRDKYVVNYIFKNKKINEFIQQCKEFSKTYHAIERTLLQLEFRSHADSSIGIRNVNEMFMEYRNLLSKFVHRKYKSIFISYTDCDDIYKELAIFQLKLEELVKSVGLIVKM